MVWAAVASSLFSVPYTFAVWMAGGMRTAPKLVLGDIGVALPLLMLSIVLGIRALRALRGSGRVVLIALVWAALLPALGMTLLLIMTALRYQT
jgi:Na+/H+-dicarboxylate symporter